MICHDAHRIALHRRTPPDRPFRQGRRALPRQSAHAQYRDQKVRGRTRGGDFRAQPQSSACDAAGAQNRRSGTGGDRTSQSYPRTRRSRQRSARQPAFGRRDIYRRPLFVSAFRARATQAGAQTCRCISKRVTPRYCAKNCAPASSMPSSSRCHSPSPMWSRSRYTKSPSW